MIDFPLLNCSVFYWQCVLFLIAALFRPFVPLRGSFWSYLMLGTVSVLIQESARYVLWTFHRFALKLLARIAREKYNSDAAVRVEDRFYLFLSYGLAQATVFALFFCIVWLPNYLNNGTLYVETCPEMSYFLVSSLFSFGFSLVLTGGMVISFDGMEKGDRKRGILAPACIHCAAVLCSLLNFSLNGCLFSIPLLLFLGMGTIAWAFLVWWRETGRCIAQGRYESVPSRLQQQDQD